MKVVLIILGFISMGIGIVGIVAPILPTTPFLLLASFFFAKGSKRFHDWFISTKIYKKYLESFVKSKAMTLKNKLTILLPVSLMLIITFIFVNNLYARLVLVILFIGKYLYFFTQIRTITEEEESKLKKNRDIIKVLYCFMLFTYFIICYLFFWHEKNRLKTFNAFFAIFPKNLKIIFHRNQLLFLSLFLFEDFRIGDHQ